MEVEETLTSAHGGAAEDGPIADASGMDDDTDEARMLALISEKEREVTALRERRLADLQLSLADKCKEVDSYKARLGKVEDDFKYNLEVLDERDRELREFEDVLAAEHKKHEERSKMLSGARNLVAALQVELKSERQASRDAEGAFRQKLFQLKEEAENAKYSRDEQLLRQKERFEKVRRDMQAKVVRAENERELERHRLTSAFGERLQQAESALRLQTGELSDRLSQAEEAIQAKDAAFAALDARHAEATRKGASLADRIAKHEARERGVHADLAQWKAAKDEAVRSLSDRVEGALRAHQTGADELKAAESVLSQAAESLARRASALEDDLRARREADMATLDAEASASRTRAEAAESRAASAEKEAEALRSAIKIEAREMSERLSRVASERDAAVAQLGRGAEEALRRHQEEARALREELWARGEELQALRQKSEGIKTHLASRRGDIRAYQEELEAAAERERELKRRCRSLELQIEMAAEGAEATAAMGAGGANGYAVGAMEAKLGEREREVVRLQEALSLAEQRSGGGEGAAMEAEDPAGGSRGDTPLASGSKATPPVPSPSDFGSPGSSLSLGSLGLFPPSTGKGAVGGVDAAEHARVVHENHRLQGVVAAMRTEMEAMPPPQDPRALAALEAELKAADADREAALAMARDVPPAGGKHRTEVAFLRSRAADLLEENVALRRRAAGLASGAGGEAGGGSSTLGADPTEHASTLHLFAKLMDMRRALLGAMQRKERDRPPPGTCLAAGDEVAALVAEACAAVRRHRTALQRTAADRDRAMALNNALRASLGASAPLPLEEGAPRRRGEVGGSEGGGDAKGGGRGEEGSNGSASNHAKAGADDGRGKAPLGPVQLATSTSASGGIAKQERETHARLDGLQSSLADLKSQSEALMRVHKETRALIADAAAMQPKEAAGHRAGQRPRRHRPGSAASGGGRGEGGQHARPASPPYPRLALAGSQAPSSSAPGRNPALSEGTDSQKQMLAALAKRKQRKEKEGREAKPSGFPKDFVKANEASGGDGRAG